MGMGLGRCWHPPSGATALYAVIGGPAITGLRYKFIIAAATGSIILTIMGVLLNNLLDERHYPVQSWRIPMPFALCFEPATPVGASKGAHIQPVIKHAGGPAFHALGFQASDRASEPREEEIGLTHNT
jgi:CBS-domain-containing membrane protein